MRPINSVLEDVSPRYGALCRFRAQTALLLLWAFQNIENALQPFFDDFENGSYVYPGWVMEAQEKSRVQDVGYETSSLETLIKCVSDVHYLV